MYFSHIFLKVSFNYVLLSRLLYSAKGISATDILPVMCLGSDVALNKSKFIIIIIIIITFSDYVWNRQKYSKLKVLALYYYITK